MPTIRELFRKTDRALYLLYLRLYFKVFARWFPEVRYFECGEDLVRWKEEYHSKHAGNDCLILVLILFPLTGVFHLLVEFVSSLRVSPQLREFVFWSGFVFEILVGLWVWFFLVPRKRLQKCMRESLRRHRGIILCQECGYDCRASKDRCPECGTCIESGLG